MLAYTGNEDSASIPLIARLHRPKHVIRVKDVNIFIDKDYMFEFNKRRES